MLMLLLTAIISGCAKSGRDTAAAPPSFGTPDEAVAALIGAVERRDVTALQSLLGPQAAGLISSGDDVADATARDTFLQRYKAYHELVAGSPKDLILLVGEDRWPLPIPIVQQGGRWMLDGRAGVEELLLRRVGANELRTISVMHGFVAAQNDYAASAHDGNSPGVFARRLRSTPGKHDGLYWEVAPGEALSPAGPLLAAASSEGYNTVTSGSHMPYHGYLYRMLGSQGPAADSGARDYLVDGQSTGGFALLAYPDSYGASGVMTFMVNQDGVIWQRDLGKDTADAAQAIQQFNPDEHWTPLAPEA